MDQIVITTPPTGATPPAATADPNRPAWLPEKFKTAEDMATAYSELEKKQGAAPPPAATAPADLSTTEAATKALTEKGLDFKSLESEYLKDGKLSDATLKTVTDKGFTPEQVNQFIEGQKAIAANNVKGIHDSVGGKDNFDKLFEYAKTHLTPTEAAAYNKAATTGDYDTLKLVLGGLQARYTAEFGKEPQLIGGKPPVANGADVYQSTAELFRDQRDPRYAKDDVYRKSVEAKAKRSTSLYAGRG